MLNILNIARANLMIYESDILHLGGTVCYEGECLKPKKRTVIRNAMVYLGGHVYHVEMKCLYDGTATVVFVHNGEVNELLDLFEELVRNDSDGEFDAYIFLRRFKQFWLGVAQTVCVLVTLWGLFHVVFRSSLLHALLAFGAIIFAYLLGKVYTRIRRYSFSKYLKKVEEDNRKFGE